MNNVLALDSVILSVTCGNHLVLPGGSHVPFIPYLYKFMIFDLGHETERVGSSLSEALCIVSKPLMVNHKKAMIPSSAHISFIVSAC